MNSQPSGRRDEWFPSSVALEDLGPYPAEVLGYRHDGMILPRFTADTVLRIVDDAQAAAPGAPRIRFTDGSVEVLSRGRAQAVLERCAPDPAGWYAFGHGSLSWQEHTTTDRAGFIRALDEAQAGGYPPESLTAWTIAFADHGHRMTLLAVFRTPHENAAAYDALYNALYASGLSSYETTAARADDAELAARRHFNGERAHVAPGAVVWPTVAPATRIPAGPR
ncbi:hypothetical protein OG413_44700 [Streptomyces sp. NBC_01433]|uniref:hypothetical protein n=1 Tax=Streptomyces sp. NBC_01433 TaxID=2903864 RepID=UPI00224E4BE2|nr:hypothetical protein [Streptomyces sp. NBC_01433]MCX4682285.1 hypothetical protein [Streptomyces sp. NBC_01433]